MRPLDAGGRGALLVSELIAEASDLLRQILDLRVCTNVRIKSLSHTNAQRHTRTLEHSRACTHKLANAYTKIHQCTFTNTHKLKFAHAYTQMYHTTCVCNICISQKCHMHTPKHTHTCKKTQHTHITQMSHAYTHMHG